MSTVEPNPALEPIEPEIIAPLAPAIIDRPLPLWKLVLVLAAPVWVQQLLHLAVSLSDSLLAGRFLDLAGEENIAGQAAQTTANYLFWFISHFSILVSVGSTALVARFIGARNRAGATLAANQSILLALAFGVTGSILGLLFLDNLVSLLQLKDETATMAVDYLEPIFVALPLQMVESVGIACLVGAGDTMTGLWIMSAVAVVNVPLAWGFCHGWGPLPALGFVGISTGTAVAQVLGGLAVLILLAHGRSGLRLELAAMRPDWSIIWRLLRVSVPAGIDSLSVVTGQLWFLSIVNRLGAVASAAHGIAIRWEALSYMSGYAFQVAAMTLVGQNLGAGRPRMAARSGWTAFGLGCGIMVAMGVVFFVLAEPMFELFCPRPEQRPVIEAGVPALRLVAWATPPMAACIILTGALRGAGDTRVPVLFTWAGFLGARIPLAYWLTGPLRWGLIGAWWAMFADLFVRGIALLIRFSSGRWQRIHV